jgi:hypothetical protein
MEIKQMVRHLDLAFAGIQVPPSRCISIWDQNTVYIYDPIDGRKGGIIILTSLDSHPLDKLFTIRNRNRTEFAIWSFDGCTDFRLFDGALTEQSCEAVVFNEQIIAWIELKMEATAFSISSANTLLSKACKQLLASVERVLNQMEAKNLPIPWKTYQAYIGTPKMFPRRQISNSLYAIRLRELGVQVCEVNVLDL